MSNKIDVVFKDKNGQLKIMNHIVAGFPSKQISVEMAVEMAKAGSDCIEVQIPFSDPLADGSVIMRANQIALNNGITPIEAFGIAKEISLKVDIPVLIMTYGNVPFRMGADKFAKLCVDAQVFGVIAPDIPFDESFGQYFAVLEDYGIYNIPVVSPDMDILRLKGAVKNGKGFVYTTLRIGTTGADRQDGVLSNSSGDFIKTIKNETHLPVAAGFGISSVEDFKKLEGRADMGIVGSKLIQIVEQEGVAKCAEFVRACKRKVG